MAVALGSIVKHLHIVEDICSRERTCSVDLLSDSLLRWVLDYLVMAIEERSCETPQRFMDALQPESRTAIDRLAGEHPDAVEACVARLVKELTPPEPEEPEPIPPTREELLAEQDRIESQTVEVRRNIDSLLESERERIAKALADVGPDQPG